MIAWYWWFVAIMLHEIGHWVGFKIFGYKAKIMPSHLGMITGMITYCEDGDKMLVWQSILMYFNGIAWGYVVLLFNKIELAEHFIYYVICTVDWAFISVMIMNGQFKTRVCDMEDRIGLGVGGDKNEM